MKILYVYRTPSLPIGIRKECFNMGIKHLNQNYRFSMYGYQPTQGIQEQLLTTEMIIQGCRKVFISGPAKQRMKHEN